MTKLNLKIVYMAKFLTGPQLNNAIDNIFKNAIDFLLIVSPYIKLHKYYRDTLLRKKKDYELQIVLVFGKNEDRVSKSMKFHDMEFFMDFPNIEIRHEPRLHAKYYSNQDEGIITSMNLYSFSQDNNIESGVLSKSSFLREIGGHSIANLVGIDPIETEASKYFYEMANEATLIYKKVAVFESSMFGLQKKYLYSNVEVDHTDRFYGRDFQTTPYKPHQTSQPAADEFVPNPAKSNYPIKNPVQYPQKNKFSSKTEYSPLQVTPEQHISPAVEANQIKGIGYCIRTGIKIPFNPKMPFTEDSFRLWSIIKNDEFIEKYCHYSGEPSQGLTCMARPILKKNIEKAKALHLP